MSMLELGDSTPRFTEAFILPPAALVSAARVDLMRQRRNRERLRDGRDSLSRLERLAFFPTDVRHGHTASGVLACALRRAHRLAHLKQIPKQKNRALIYGGIPRLQSALLIAQLAEIAETP